MTPNQNGAERREIVSRAWYETLDRLGAALEERRPEAEIRSIIRVSCADARRRDLPPEKLIVLLKRRLTRVRALRRPRGDLITDDDLTPERLVRMLIEEYYDGASAKRG